MNLHDAITNAMEMMWRNPVVEPEQYVVHPAEHAWITNPVGPPPTTNAVIVAMQVGAIDGSHPAVEALMSQHRAETLDGDDPQGGVDI